MRPLVFVWPYALAFWIVYVWAYWPEFGIVRRARRAQAPTDSKSLQVLLVVQSLAMFAGFPLAFVPAFRVAPAHPFVVYFLGIGVIVAASLLRRHCFRMLGSSFTGDVRVSADQQVVTRGAYRFVRHPAYTAGILLNTGCALALGSWASIVVVAIGTLAAYLYRMHVEERALLAALGEPYRQFMSTRKRLIPFVY